MSTCQPDNDYDGRIGVRISAIFVIGICSLFGKSQLKHPREYRMY